MRATLSPINTKYCAHKIEEAYNYRCLLTPIKKLVHPRHNLIWRSSQCSPQHTYPHFIGQFSCSTCINKSSSVLVVPHHEHADNTSKHHVTMLALRHQPQKSPTLRLNVWLGCWLTITPRSPSQPVRFPPLIRPHIIMLIDVDGLPVPFAHQPHIFHVNLLFPHALYGNKQKEK